MKAPNKTSTLPISTSEGVFLARYSSDGLTALDFPSARTAGVPPSKSSSSNVVSWHAKTSSSVKAVLAGKPAAALPPMAPAGTAFQQSVWHELRKIPAGKTLGYGAIAAALGRPRAARAVGQACGANPIPLLIPCHRVLAAGGKLGGYSGGLDWKRRLLDIEGVAPR